MTPKEKAKELVNKFMFTSFNIQENTDDFKFKLLIQAKQCALIAVDETLCVLSDLCCDFVGNDIIEKEIAYWKQVKQELNKSK